MRFEDAPFVGVIVDREWYRYFSRKLDNKCKWNISNDKGDKKPAACPKKDDNDNAQSLLILPFNSFGQGGGISPTDYFSHNHVQLVAL